MATKKKQTNYIGYDLEWLETQYQQLKQWCEDKLKGGIQDRIEIYESTRGNPIIKVIASEETQIKALRDTLKEIPSMLIEINRLRKQVEEEESGETNVRGDHNIPGFMEDDDDVPVEKEKPKKESKPKKQSPKALPPSSPTFFDDDGDFEDP